MSARWLFSSHTRKRSRRKTTREPYVPVIRDDVVKSARQARSRHDDVIYPSLLVDDCARVGAAAGCRDCACAAGFGVAADALAACDGTAAEDATRAADGVPRQRQRRRRPVQLPCCAADYSCARRSSTSAHTHRKFTAVAPPFPTPPPPPPPPPPTSAASRARALDARVCCGVMTTTSHDAILPVAEKSATITTSFDNDLMLQPPAAVVDRRLNCTSTDVAPYETCDVTD